MDSTARQTGMESMDAVPMMRTMIIMEGMMDGRTVVEVTRKQERILNPVTVVAVCPVTRTEAVVMR